MGLNNLSSWDSSGKLSPYPQSTGEQMVNPLMALIKMFQANQKSKAFKSATGKLGVDLGDFTPSPEGQEKLLIDLALEKNKTFAPQKPQSASESLAQIELEKVLQGFRNQTQPNVPDALGGAVPGSEMPGTVPAIPPVTDGRPQQFISGKTNKYGLPEQIENPDFTVWQRGREKEKELEYSPFFQENKAKRAEDLVNTSEQGKVQKDMITQAQEATGKIPTGIGGKLQMWWNKMFDPENPMMGEWQKIKMVLTDAQLMNTAKTKGAISDQEMALFSRAAANDDIASIQAMKPVFDKLTRFIDMEKTSKTKSYKAIYKEDPSEFLGADDPLGIR